MNLDSQHRKNLESRTRKAVIMTGDRSALFCIDIQNDLAAIPETRIPAAERLRTNSEAVLASARSIIDGYRSKDEDSPSILVVVQHEENPDSGPLVRGTPPWELVYPPRDGVAEEWLVSKTTGAVYCFIHVHFLCVFFFFFKEGGQDRVVPTFESPNSSQVIPLSPTPSSPRNSEPRASLISSPSAFRVIIALRRHPKAPCNWDLM
jgi:hypothetical protein